jgi:O-succinylbenzoate synthase
MEALVLSTNTTVPVITQPETASVKITVYSATADVYTWFTLIGGISAAPICTGDPSPQLMLYPPILVGEAISKVKFDPLQLYHCGVLLGVP